MSLSGSSAVLLSCCCFSFLSSFSLCLSTLSFLLPFSGAFRFFFRGFIAGAFSSASRSLPSAPCSSYSSVSSFSFSHPCSSLSAWVCGVLVFLQCSFGFHPCCTFLIFSFRLSSFSHSDVQFSSSSVYGLGSLLAERFCTLGFTCSHFYVYISSLLTIMFLSV